MKRTFIIGDDWIYLKLYTGIKVADQILIEYINPLCKELLNNKIIDKWFYIRYSDPMLHLRIRFHTTNSFYFSNIIILVNNSIQDLIKEDIIWKVQFDTYEREIERYGINTIDIAETFFYHDSTFVINLLNIIKTSNNENLRWQFCLYSIDQLLDNFNYSLIQKHELFTSLSNSYINEIGAKKYIYPQIGNKYRKEKDKIEAVLNSLKLETSEFYPIIYIFQQNNNHLRPIIIQLLKLYNTNKAEVSLHDLLKSIIHMHCNRLFRSKQRVHEVVIYTFLEKYYKSQMERTKKNKVF